MFAQALRRATTSASVAVPCLLAAFAPLAAAQDRILYKFDGACTGEVINHAPLGYGNGTLTAANGTGFTAGRFAGGLGAGDPSNSVRNVVDTGWSPAATPWTGDLTIAFWARRETPLAVSQVSYFFGTSSSGFRLFTGGFAGRGLALRSVASGTGDLLLDQTVVDVQSLADTNWVHLAVTVDDTAHVVTWYVNGVAVSTVSTSLDLQIDSPGSLLVGGYASASSSAYALDEVLLGQRLYSAAEIAELATGTRAGFGAYSSGTTTQCNPGLIALDSTGGRPFFGNLNYALRVNATANQLWLLLYGETRCTLGGVLPLPLDGGLLLPELAGCQLLADPLLLVQGVVGPVVPASIPLPISTALPSGASAFCQVLGLQANGTVAMSNGFTVSVGF